MENEESKIKSQILIKDFKGVNFQLALEIFRQQQVNLKNGKEYGDLYLMERLFPVLIEGLERLSFQVEKYLQHPEEIDIEVRKRFNPCIFLGQFMMRNNPMHNEQKLKEDQYKIIIDHVRTERFKRYFTDRQNDILRFFMKTINHEKNSCEMTEMRIFFKELDEQLQAEGQLKDYMYANKYLSRLKQDIQFDTILEELIKWCSTDRQIQTGNFDAIFTS